MTRGGDSNKQQQLLAEAKRYEQFHDELKVGGHPDLKCMQEFGIPSKASTTMNENISADFDWNSAIGKAALETGVHSSLQS